MCDDDDSDDVETLGNRGDDDIRGDDANKDDDDNDDDK